ncbi:indole-3-glycerol phosphate synthase TrpC [Neolewinella lacunae]|uniref:indole-3-glycerol-phosphate synthase n=1 Tax=Neolewinella lacunae TaxID=1517758 RepID=A0A923PJI2_9BACT|nr:indole-3-glycerol phosphate synthase TrpC [Neolewinella lacunae]MBC6994484.1 indole-3-glycerol-phosphate synthase [Neolewinella lacunae]MDN3634177.1 indole-3-glycerol phosphate synthase TrpC [Neolewinella lacunae]
METILDRINAHKMAEVALRREQTPLSALRDSADYAAPRRSLVAALRDSTDYGIIAEFKRKSPSQNDINLAADPAAIAQGYAGAGAAGISCLTDGAFFGALPTDFAAVRRSVDLPLIRKDFVVDPYQLHEARAMGGDVVLLIAASLSAAQIADYTAEAHSLGLEVLCEVHNEEEVGRLSPEVDIVGVNNRNLKDFSVSIHNSIRLAELLPPGIPRISESGIEDPQAIARLRRAGYRGFLIGTYFMREADAGRALADFVGQVRTIEDLYDGAIA